MNRRGGHSVTISVPTSLGTLVLPADSGLMSDSPLLTRSVECGSRRSFEGIQHMHRVDASAGCLSGHSTSLLCSGDRPICVAFEPSATSLCVTTSRSQCISSGCLSTGLEPVEEFHTPTSGATASNSSESEKRESNRPASSPRLARSTMVCPDSTDGDRYTDTTLVLPADSGLMSDSPLLTGSVGCGSRPSFEGIQLMHRVDASAGCLSGHSTSLLCSGDRPICVAFEPSATSLCVTTSRSQCISSGCLSTGLEPVEEFHTPTSGATASNSSESEKRESNRPARSPRLARSTMVCPDSTDDDRYTVPTSQGELTAVFAFRPRGSSPSVAVSQSDCMADIGSSYQAAGFPEEVINVLLASWSQSTKKRYRGPWWAWSNWCSSRGLCAFSAPVTDVLTFLMETLTNRSLEYRTLAVYKSAISQGHLPVAQTKLGDLPVVSRFMKGIFRMKPTTPRLSSTWDVKRISSQAMSRWLRKAMQLAGIACHFTGHSTGSASTSAAARAGVPLDTSLVAVDWSSSETFKRFYLRSPDKGVFARAVLTVLPE